MVVPGPAGQNTRAAAGQGRVQGLLGLDQLLTPSPPLSISPCWLWLQCVACIQFLPFPWACRGQQLPSAHLLPPQFHDVFHGNKTTSLPCWEGAATAKDEPPGPRHSMASLCQPRGKANPTVLGVRPKPQVPLCKQRLGHCGAGVPARWGRWRLACCCARADLSVPYASLFQPCLPSEPIVDHNVLSALEKEISCNCFAGLAARCKTFCLSAPSPA